MGKEVCVSPSINIASQLMVVILLIFRYAFNITLLIGGAFGIAAGGANNFIVLALLVALVGMGVGGSLVISY